MRPLTCSPWSRTSSSNAARSAILAANRNRLLPNPALAVFSPGWDDFRLSSPRLSCLECLQRERKPFRVREREILGVQLHPRSHSGLRCSQGLVLGSSTPCRLFEVGLASSSGPWLLFPGNRRPAARCPTWDPCAAGFGLRCSASSCDLPARCASGRLTVTAR